MPQTLDCGATIATAGDAPGSLITRPRQLEFGGLLLGAGTPYLWKNFTGWDDAPDVDLSDSPRETADGDDPGPGFRQARIAAHELAILADTPEHMEQLVRLLIARMDYSDVETPLHVRDTSRTLMVRARVLRRAGLNHVPTRTIGWLDGVGIQWKATDPRRTSPEVRTVRLTPDAATGGEAYPSVYPTDYGTPGGVSSRTVVNATSDEARGASPVVRFTGPAEGDYFVQLADGRQLRYELPLAVGEVLTVDTRTGVVDLNGVDRSSWIHRASEDPQSWRLPPGESVVSFSVPFGAGATTAVDLEWSDTWK